MTLMRILGLGLALTAAVAATEIPGRAEASGEGHTDTPFEATVDETWRLTLKEFLQLVRDRNERIQFQDAELAIKKEGIYSARGVFEPTLTGDYQHADTFQQQTIREFISTGLFPTRDFFETSNDYDLAIESLAPTGAQLRLGYNLRDFRNSFNQDIVPREVKSFLGISATQPLLKNAGINTNKAGIRVAEEDAGIAFQNYREQMMKVMAEAIVTYWSLRLAQDKQAVRQDSVNIAEQILNDNTVRVRTGKMAATEVLEAKAGLALRRSFLAEAKQSITSSMNTARTLFSTSGVKAVPIEAVDEMKLAAIEADVGKSLGRAYRLRAEYLAGFRKVEREQIRVLYAKNQTYPELDLKGSYGLNGLGEDLEASTDQLWDPTYRTWEVGLQFRVPLSGNRKNRGEFNAAKKRKEQALLELKAIEVSVVNSVDTAIQKVQNTAAQVSYFSEAVSYNIQLLAAELARLDAGKSNSRIVLEKEENLLRAREAALDSLVNYQRAVVELDMAEGSLLLSHGIEIMQEALR